MVCQKCGNFVADGVKFCSKCGANMAEAVTASQGMNFDFNTNTASAEAPKRYTYKVLSQKDKWFSGKFDPEILEQAINSYAAQGWRVIGCATADIPGFGATRQEFVTLLEREV